MVTLFPDAQDTVATWRSRAQENPGAALNELASLPKGTLATLPEDEVADTWRRYAGANPNWAMSVFPSLPFSVQSLVQGDELRRTWLRMRPHLHLGPALGICRQIPALLAALRADEIVGVWRTAARAEPPLAVLLLDEVEALLGEVLPRAEVADAWRAMAVASPGEALHELGRLPAEARAQVAADDVADAWRGLAAEASLEAALSALERLPADAFALLGESDWVRLFRWHAPGEPWNAYAWIARLPEPLRGTVTAISPSALGLPASEDIAIDWLSRVERGNKTPHARLAGLPDEVRQRLGPETIARSWSRLAKMDPAQAMASLPQLDDTVLSCLGPQDFAPLLSCRDTQVRLGAISSLGRLRSAAPAEMEAATGAPVAVTHA